MQYHTFILYLIIILSMHRYRIYRTYLRAASRFYQFRMKGESQICATCNKSRARTEIFLHSIRHVAARSLPLRTDATLGFKSRSRLRLIATSKEDVEHVGDGLFSSCLSYLLIIV